MSIAGGMFNSNQKREDVDDAGAAADGATEGMEEEAVDLTTAVPDFGEDEDEDEEGLVLGEDVLAETAETTEGASPDQAD